MLKMRSYFTLRMRLVDSSSIACIDLFITWKFISGTMCPNRLYRIWRATWRIAVKHSEWWRLAAGWAGSMGYSISEYGRGLVGSCAMSRLHLIKSWFSSLVYSPFSRSWFRMVDSCNAVCSRSGINSWNGPTSF